MSCTCQRVLPWVVLGLSLVKPEPASGLEWSVSPGAGGLVMQEGWAYVVVEVTTGTEPFEGEIVVESPGAVRGIHHLPIEQPPGSSRRYAVYFRCTTDDCGVSLQVKGRPLGKPKPVALVSKHPTSCILEVGTGTQIDLAFRSKFLRVNPYARSDWESLPGDPVGYDNAEWLMVSDPQKGSELSYGQARALRTWVETGGKMMVFVRAGQQPTGVIRDLLEEAGLSTRGIVTVGELKALSARVACSEKPETGAVVALAAPPGTQRWVEEGVVLSTVAPVGWGTIGLCGLHPGLVNGLPTDKPEFWQFIGGIELTVHRTLLRLAGPGFRPRSQKRFSEEFGDLLIPGEVAFPLTMGWVIVYLLAYLAVVGPLQGWLLKKGASFRASLAVFILSVLVFVVFASAVVQRKKGKELWQKDIGILTIGDSGAARGLMHSSFFVPASGDLKFALGSEVLACPMSFESQSWVTEEGRRDWNLWLTPRATEATLNFRQWDVRSVLAVDWHHPSALAEVSPLPKGLSPKLRRAHLVSERGVSSLGDIEIDSIPEPSAQRRWLEIEDTAATLAKSYKAGKDHSQKEIEDVLLALCLGQPESVVELDVLRMVKRGRTVLVGFAEYPPLVPELGQRLGKHTSLCLVRMLLPSSPR